MRSTRGRWDTGPCLLWELGLAATAEAEFLEAAVRELMLPIHHGVCGHEGKERYAAVQAPPKPLLEAPDAEIK